MNNRYSLGFVFRDALPRTNNESDNFQIVTLCQYLRVGGSQRFSQGADVYDFTRFRRFFRIPLWCLLQRSFYSQDRARSISQDLLCHATGEEPAESGPPMCAHYNEIAGKGLSQKKYFRRGVSFGHSTFDTNGGVRRLGPVESPFQAFLGLCFLEGVGGRLGQEGSGRGRHDVEED
jgi:hypothetical protein